MITIYAEKPSVARTIVSAISDSKTIKHDGYIELTFKREKCCVTWGFGHLCELKQASDYDPEYKNWKNIPLPFVPSKIETKFKSDYIKQINIISDLFKKSSLIINATDFEREGDLIFFYLMEALGCKKPYKRLALKSLELSAVRNSLDNLLSPADIQKRLDAAKARSFADFIVGSNITVAMTLGFSTKDVLSVGRVQTPTLNILAEREKEIANFKSSKYFVIQGDFTDEKDKSKSYKGVLDCDKIVDEKEAQEIFNSLKPTNPTIFDVEKKRYEKELPYLYNLSSLQMDANGLYGFSLDKTLQIAQSLYEKGYTTYPRTDSIFLTEDMLKTVNDILKKLFLKPQYASLSQPEVKNYSHWFNNKKVSAHTAIIPTMKNPTSLLPDEEKIYDLICRSVICMTYDNAVMERVTIKTKADDYVFVSKGNVVVNKNWLTVSLSQTKEVFLPEVTKGTKVIGEYTIQQKETEPPKRYTDKTLVAAMLNAGRYVEDEELKKILASDEVKGIGTEATRSGILNALIKRGYVQRNKKALIPTDKGMFLINTIPIKEIKSPAYTAEWEKRLSLIEKGECDFDTFINDIIKQTTEWCKSLQTASKGVLKKAPDDSEKLRCPLCGKPIHKFEWGWSCTGYKDGCKFKLGAVIAKKKITDRQAEKLITDGKTSVIKGFKSKAGKSFSAALEINKENGNISFVFQ